MQRFTNSLYSNSSRCFRFSQFISKNASSSDQTHLYTTSTEKKETRVPDDLKGGQSAETIDTNVKITPTLTGTSKVWSVQNSGSVHVAPLAKVAMTEINPTDHQTTVHATQGQVNLADPFKTQQLQPEITTGKLAEAAAASAFGAFAPDTTVKPPAASDPVFAPKISATDLYSTSTSPTAHFESVVPNLTQENVSYETRQQGKVFGGQDTSASDKKHPKGDSFSGKTQEIPIQRESDIRENILREALQYVDERGWTLDAIRGGIRAANQPSTVEGLFSNGYDLVEYFMKDSNDKMSAYMAEQSQKGGITGSRLLVEGLKYRLRLVIPYARTWDQALAQGALPQNAMRSWKCVLDVASNAWNGIGDTSADLNWYTKRLIVAAIYRSAEVYMLQDETPDKTDTIEFLERRLSDFQTIGSVRNTVSKSFSDTTQIATGLFSVVRNLTSRR